MSSPETAINQTRTTLKEQASSSLKDLFEDESITPYLLHSAFSSRQSIRSTDTPWFRDEEFGPVKLQKLEEAKTTKKGLFRRPEHTQTLWGYTILHMDWDLKPERFAEVKVSKEHINYTYEERDRLAPPETLMHTDIFVLDIIDAVSKGMEQLSARPDLLSRL